MRFDALKIKGVSANQVEHVIKLCRIIFFDKLEEGGSDSIKLKIFYVRKTICTIFCANCSQQRSILPAAPGLSEKMILRLYRNDIAS